MLVLQIVRDDGAIHTLLQPAHDVSIPVRPYAATQVSAFGLPPAAATPLCSVDGGASVNCPELRFSPHGSGTHTECVGHCLPGCVTLADVPLPASTLCLAVVVTIRPDRLDACSDAYSPGAPSDAVISRAALENAALGAAAASALLDGALVVRTLPNELEKRERHWSGTNPPYFTEAALAWARAAGVRRLLCDLPSVDREVDGGALLAHRAFWGVSAVATTAASAALSGRTITELCYVGERVADGLYVLDLAVSPIHADAAPSRPLLYALGPARRS